MDDGLPLPEGPTLQPSARRGRRRPRARRGPARALGLGAAAAAPLVLAFQGGGYDIVVRQEFGLVLWWSIAILALLGLIPRSRPSRPARVALAALAGMVGWSLLTLAWTASAERTFAEVARLIVLASIPVIAYLGLHRATWRQAADGAIVALLTLPLVALSGRLVPELPWADASNAFEGRRLLGPLEYWNAMAAWGAMAFGASLLVSSHRRRPALRGLALAATPVAGAVVYLTYSRAGVAGVILAVALAIGLGANRVTVALHALAASAATAVIILVIRSQTDIAEGVGGGGALPVALVVLAGCALCAVVARATRRSGIDRARLPERFIRPGLIACIGVALLGTALLGPSVTSRAGDQFFGAGYPDEVGDPAARLASLEGSRAQVWGSALDAFEAKPAGGIGPGTFELWWTRTSTEAEVLRDAHSLYLETLAEQGLPGFALLVAMLAAALAAAVRARAAMHRTRDRATVSALILVFVLFLFHAGIDWMWESTAVAVMALGSIAVAGAAAGRRRRPDARRGWWLAGVALLAGITQVPGIVATDRLRASTAALQSGAPDAAVDLAEDAVRAQPWAATPYAARALAALDVGDLDRAEVDSKAAIDREPTGWRLWRLRFAVLQAAGSGEEALAALDRMVELNPRSAQTARRLERAANRAPDSAP
jgi:hypothetical protein